MRSFPVKPSSVLSCLPLALLLLAVGCARPESNAELLASYGKPTIYATVKRPPNPLLLGHYIRTPPTEYKRPDAIEYFLYKDEQGYAFHLTWKGKSGIDINEWFPAEIDGDTIKAGETIILVEGSKVFHRLQGRDVKHYMARQ